eukprot:59404_1
MGIKSLLLQLKDITADINLNSYKGKKVGVDAYVWLHQKVYCCATEICLQRPTNSYVRGFIKEVQTLLRYGVIPVIVFDGGYLPSKAKVEEDRAESRKAYLEKGKRHLAEGNAEEAHTSFVKAIDITPQMAFEVILKLKQMNIEYYVAPYEADAQLAYLYKIGHIFAVISIDSDLLPFGCHRLLTKYNKGWVKEVTLHKLNQNYNPLNFSQFSFEMFLQFCILCGCDYLSSIPGIGPKTAHQYMLKCKKWSRALKCIKFDGKHRVPKDYEAGFKQALYTFRHQRVYDPTQKRLVHLQPLPSDQPSMAVDTDFLGPSIEASVAQQIAEGVIDPITRQPLVPQTQPLPHISTSISTCNTGWKKKIKKKKPKASQSNTMWSYLNKKEDKKISVKDGMTESSSPPAPAVIFEKSFERNKASIQFMSDKLELLQKNGQSLDAFAFGNNHNMQQKASQNTKQEMKDGCEYDARQHSETQAIDSISNRHKRAQHNTTYSSDEVEDNLDDVMSQFAFGNATKKRSRELLPSKPIGSVDYNTQNSVGSHEATPHQFRPPRMQYNKNRSKKRRLNEFKHTTHHFESTFIPAGTGSFALCSNTSTIPQGGLTAFAFRDDTNTHVSSRYEQIEEYQASNKEDNTPSNHHIIEETQDNDVMGDAETMLCSNDYIPETPPSDVDDPINPIEFEENDGNFLDENDDIDILSIHHELRIQSPTLPMENDGIETIDLTNDDSDDNEGRQNRIEDVISLIDDDTPFRTCAKTLLIDDDEDDALNEDEDVLCLSPEEDKENDSFNHNLNDKVRNKKSPLIWKKKIRRSRSPDPFDASYDDNEGLNVDILSQDIALTINEDAMENVIDFESQLCDVEEDSIGIEDEDCLRNVFDDDFDIDTLPMDVVRDHPTKLSARRYRHKLRLQHAEFDAIQNRSSLEENDYF